MFGWFPMAGSKDFRLVRNGIRDSISLNRRLPYVIKGLPVKILRPFVFVRHVEAEATAAQKLKDMVFNVKAKLYEVQWTTRLAKQKAQSLIQHRH